MIKRRSKRRANSPAKMSEHDHQVALIKWARLNARAEPRLKWLHSIPNGAHVSKAQAGKLKAEGMTAGVADLFLPAKGVDACGDALGLYIEMKSRGGRWSAEQKAFASAVMKAGYTYNLCYSWVSAAIGICQYLENDALKENLIWADVLEEGNV